MIIDYRGRKETREAKEIMVRKSYQIERMDWAELYEGQIESTRQNGMERCCQGSWRRSGGCQSSYKVTGVEKYTKMHKMNGNTYQYRVIYKQKLNL